MTTVQPTLSASTPILPSNSPRSIEGPCTSLISEEVAPMTSASNQARLPLLALPDDALRKIVEALLAAPIPLGQPLANAHLKSVLRLASKNSSLYQMLTSARENSAIPLHLEIEQKQLDQRILQHALTMIESHGDTFEQISLMTALMEKGIALLDTSHLQALEQKIEQYLQRPDIHLAALINTNTHLLTIIDYSIAVENTELLQSTIHCFEALEQGYDRLSQKRQLNIDIIAADGKLKTQADLIDIALKTQDYESAAQRLKVQQPLARRNPFICKKMIQQHLDFMALLLKEGVGPDTVSFNLENAKTLLQSLRRSMSPEKESIEKFTSSIERLEGMLDQPKSAALRAQLSLEHPTFTPPILDQATPCPKPEFIKGIRDQREGFMALLQAQPLGDVIGHTQQVSIQPILDCINLLSEGANPRFHRS